MRQTSQRARLEGTIEHAFRVVMRAMNIARESTQTEGIAEDLLMLLGELARVQEQGCRR